jgi:hypothetical protein
MFGGGGSDIASSSIIVFFSQVTSVFFLGFFGKIKVTRDRRERGYGNKVLGNKRGVGK